MSAFVGPYRLVRRIGAGGASTVFEAVREGAAPSDRSPVALKWLDAGYAGVAEIDARMEREARAVTSIHDPHVVSVFELGRHEGRPYLVMELLRGRDLGAVLGDERALEPARAVRIVSQVLRGLRAAHAAGVLHRDLKPENVVVEDEGTAKERVKVVDFGMSKLEENDGAMGLTARGTVIGTPAYVAPEQARAAEDVDARADVYAAGALLFECLAGRPPHVEETHERVLLAICTTDAPDVRTFAPSVPEPLAAVVRKALQRDRAARFGSADEMLAALGRALGPKPKKTPLVTIVLGVVAALAGAALTTWWLTR